MASISQQTQPLETPHRLDLARAAEAYRRFAEGKVRRSVQMPVSAADWMASGLARGDMARPSPMLSPRMQQAGIAIAFVLGILVKLAIS